VVLAGGGPLAAALTLLGVRCLAVLVQIAASLRLAQWLGEARGRVSAERARELLRPALAAMLLPFAQAGYVQGTALAVGAAAGPVAVSIFTTLRTLSRVGLQLLMAINQPLLPDYTAAYARGRIEWLRQTASALLAAALVAGLGFALGLYFMGDAVIELWTGGAIAVPGLMLGLVALAVPFAALWNTLANLLLATNRHEAFAAVFLVAAGLSTVLTYVLVVNGGVALAPGAMLLLDVAMTVLGIRMLSKSLDCGSNQLIASLGSGAGKYAFGRGREEGAGK
jgi:O-antigen/teichoic acid export membrane protein